MMDTALHIALRTALRKAEIHLELAIKELENVWLSDINDDFLWDVNKVQAKLDEVNENLQSLIDLTQINDTD